MKKRITAAALMLSITLTMSGCFPTGEKDPNVSNVLPQSDTFEYEKEKLKVRFDVPTAPENLPIRIRLKEKYFDFETIEKTFLDGKTIVPEESEDIIYWTTDHSFLEFGEEMNEIRFYEGTVCYPGLDAPEKVPMNYYLNLKYSHECYREEFSIGEELDGFSSQSAIDRALELCSKLGINDLGKPEVYAFDINSYEKFKQSNFSDSWFNEDVPFTKDNEVYILRFKQTFSGVELAPISDTSIDDSTAKTKYSTVDSPEVVVGVSKDGIFHFMVLEAYETEYEVVNTEPIKFGVDYALSEFTSYLETKYFKGETVFEDACVVYYPVERKEEGYVEFTAAWCFKGFQRDGGFPGRVLFDHNNIFFLTDNGYRKDETFSAQ